MPHKLILSDEIISLDTLLLGQGGILGRMEYKEKGATVYISICCSIKLKYNRQLRCKKVHLDELDEN